MYDLIIKNANIIDGTGNRKSFGDLAISSGIIVDKGKGLGKAKKIINADGLCLSPGIIDTHTHYDAQLTWDNLASPSLDLGVTTILIGNCGFTIAPCKEKHRDLNMRNLTKVEGMPYKTLKKGIDWNYKTYSEYLNLIEKKKPYLNVCSYIGHSALRIWCMGEDAMKREANEKEIEDMENIVKDAMLNGAIGFSTSTFEGHNGTDGTPMPSRFASEKEIKKLINAMAIQSRGIFMITKSNTTSAKQISRLIGKSKRPAMIAAIFHNPAKPNWAINSLKEIEEERKKGYELWGQVSCRPLTMEFTMNEPYMLEGLSSWKEYMIEKNSLEKRKILKNKNFRKKVLNEILDKSKNKLFIGDWRKITLLNSNNDDIKPLEGKNLQDISNLKKKTPLDWLLDNALNNGMNDLFKAELLNSDHKKVAELLNNKNSTVSLSDAGAHLSLLCDAGYGLDLLGKWVREHKIMSLEEAVYKLTAKQADICRIPKRGRLVPGYFADCILFDPTTIGCSQTKRINDLPDGSSRLILEPKGLHKVFVNGKEYIKNKTKPSGKIIKSFLV